MKNGLIIDEINTKRWYKDGKLHREDGPAVEYVDGERRWLKNGYLHREDGPAVECCNTIKYWCYNGQYLKASSQEELIRYMNLKLFW